MSLARPVNPSQQETRATARRTQAVTAVDAGPRDAFAARRPRYPAGDAWGRVRSSSDSSDALQALVEQVKQDRSVLAAVLCGSLSHDTVWAKSDIDLLLVTIDDKKVAEGERALYADGVNVHAVLLPRAQFRSHRRGLVRNSFIHALLAKGRLLYTHDESIAELCAARRIGERDSEVLLLSAATEALAYLYKAHKWLLTRGDLEYTALFILYTARALARLEVIGARPHRRPGGDPPGQRAQPAACSGSSTATCSTPRRPARRAGGARHLDRYLAERAPRLFAPVLDHLREVGEARSATDLEDHFHRNFGVEGVTTACEYLADQGLVGKASTAVQLTRRSNTSVQELAFFHLADGDRPRRRPPGSPKSRTPARAPPPPERGAMAADPPPPPCPSPGAADARPRRARPRTTIAVQGARVHNLKNVSVELPRDQLIVVTGLSGSGKSSLAFDTIYAEGQRRYMESLSTLRQALRGPGGQAGRGLRVRAVAGHLHRAEDHRQQPALDRRHHDRHRQLPEPAVRHHRRSPTARAAASPRPAAAPARSWRPSWPCPRGPRSSCARRCSRSTARTSTSSSPSCARRAAARLVVDGKPRSTSPTKLELDEAGGRAHGRGGRPLRRQPPAREGHQGRHRRHAAGGRRTAADAASARGAGKAEAERFYQGLCSPTHHFVYGDIGPSLLHLQRPRERLPHLRRPGRAQADPPRAAGARPQAQHRRRLLRARGLPLQPGHLGRPRDVQPGAGAALLARHALAGSARQGARTPSSTASSRRKITLQSPPEAKIRRDGLGRASRSASAASPAASSATTAATASAARPAPAWRSGSTR